jgi:arylsulfatase
LEGGIATPLIAYWPATIHQPGITREPGHVIDLMATCLDAAGAEYPRTYEGRPILPLEGRSLVPVFRTGHREPHPALFWEHEGHRAVRQGDWKLVATPAGKWELYDLARDRTESTNVAAANAEKVQELTALYQAWAQRCGVVPWADLAAKAKSGGR